jgi:hypothetical protein
LAQHCATSSVFGAQHAWTGAGFLISDVMWVITPSFSRLLARVSRVRQRAASGRSR